MFFQNNFFNNFPQNGGRPFKPYGERAREQEQENKHKVHRSGGEFANAWVGYGDFLKMYNSDDEAERKRLERWRFEFPSMYDYYLNKVDGENEG